MCYSAEVVIYLFFNYGMECNTLSVPKGVAGCTFQYSCSGVGLFTLVYMDSLIALAILCSSLPVILKFSTDVLCSVLLWYSKIGDSAFKCYLYLSPNVLDDSPMYSSPKSILSHLNQ